MDDHESMHYSGPEEAPDQKADRRAERVWIIEGITF